MKYPIVVKLTDFVVPDGVRLCHDIAEAKDHSSYLVGLLKKSGLDTSIICQKYLKEKEYVIVHELHDGAHKTTSKYNVIPAVYCTLLASKKTHYFLPF